MILKILKIWLVFEAVCFALVLGLKTAGAGIVRDNCDTRTFTCRTLISPHPYAGYSRSGRKAGEFGENREGFLSDTEFPLKREEGKRYVGIFGGSVADTFCQYSRIAKPLREYFAERYKVERRDIRILCFAQAGYKQPQQMILAALYARELDFVINIEGFTELSMVHLKNYPAHFPDPNLSAYVYRRDGDPAWEQWASLVMTEPYWWSQGAVKWELPSVSALKLLVNRTVWYWANSVNREAVLPDSTRDAVLEIEANRDLWQRYGEENMRILLAMGKPFLYVIQPMLPLRRDISESEKMLLAAQRAPRIESLRKQTPAVIKKFMQNRDFAPYIFDATGVFQGTPGTVFRDLCHFTAEGPGNARFTEAVIQRLRAK